MPIRTYVHIAALATAIVSLGVQLAPAKDAPKPVPTFTNPLTPLIYPGAGEWNCSQQAKAHPCHKHKGVK